MLRKTLILVQPELLRQEISWDLDCPVGDLWINGDLKHLRQMFLHLVKNAIEAMPSGGRLEVAVGQNDELVHVAIRDTGVGMPEDTLDQAKNPFFTTKTYGTGLGLTMVENVLEMHGGNFVMNRRDSGGLEVRVNLPRSLLLAPA